MGEGTYDSEYQPPWRIKIRVSDTRDKSHTIFIFPVWVTRILGK